MEESLCEAYVRNQCPIVHCEHRHHFQLPYLWQVYFSDSDGWMGLLPEDSVEVERGFCIPWKDMVELELTLPEKTGAVVKVLSRIDFESMKAQLCHQGEVMGPVAVRRLSTHSYGHVFLNCKQGAAEEEVLKDGFYTQWRWYYNKGGTWAAFGVDNINVMQSVLETKYLAGQEVFRFCVPSETASNKKVCLLSYAKMAVANAETGERSMLRRRPLFVPVEYVQSGISLPFPAWKPVPYLTSLPKTWFPINLAEHFELIVMNPESMDFHMVASELVQKMPEKKAHEIYRVQNPYLWHRYITKRQYMEDHGQQSNEKQLFHGTSDARTAQAIIRHNFDWRLCGKNATVWGQGSYFALHADFSHRYTGEGAPFHWMFLARVLVGRSVRGHRDYTRPPAIHPCEPHSDLYDSCVDSETSPRIFVIFEADQCYPEYLIGYK